MILWISSVKTKKKKVNIGTFLTFKLFIVNMLFILSCCTDWFRSQSNITTNKWTTWIICAEFIWPECNRRYLTKNSSLFFFNISFKLLKYFINLLSIEKVCTCWLVIYIRDEVCLCTVLLYSS